MSPLPLYTAKGYFARERSSHATSSDCLKQRRPRAPAGWKGRGNFVFGSLSNCSTRARDRQQNFAAALKSRYILNLRQNVGDWCPTRLTRRLVSEPLTQTLICVAPIPARQSKPRGFGGSAEGTYAANIGPFHPAHFTRFRLGRALRQREFTFQSSAAERHSARLIYALFRRATTRATLPARASRTAWA